MQAPTSTIENHQDIAIDTQSSTRAQLFSTGLRDYLALTKPRVISLLLAITLVPMFLATGEAPELFLIVTTLIGGFLAAGGANAINQYVDRDIDHVMVRTAQRPLPSGRMQPVQVLIFGLALSVLSFLLLWSTANLLTGLLALGGVILYVGLYTIILKRHSMQNIVIGGVAGCFPPLVGWAAVTNEIGLPAIFMFLIVFYWTPPHFWALALRRQKEYLNARVPMLPVIVGPDETRQQILLYSILLALSSIAPVFLGVFGPLYLIGALILNGLFLKQAWDLLSTPTDKNTLRLYVFSLLYLALLFLAMGIDGLFYTIPAELLEWRLQI